MTYNQELPEWTDEVGAELLRSLPLFVSIPRSGCNWIQAVMELYFNRHRAFKGSSTPTWLESKYENPMWMHTHDEFANSTAGSVTTNKPAIFLWRDPVDTIYSLAKLQLSNVNNAVAINDWCHHFAKCHNKWTSDSENVLAIKYGIVVKNPLKELRKISEWHDVPFDEAKAQWAFDVVGDKKKTNSKNGKASHFKNEASHTSEYSDARKQFRDKWEITIVDRVCQLTEKLTT